MIVRAASYEDWRAWLEARGQAWAQPEDLAVLRQLLTGPAWALGVPLAALAGTVHAEHSVIWIAPTPAAARAPVALVRALRALVVREQSLIGRPLWAEVDPDNRDGQRLVALLGFARVAQHVWRSNDKDHPARHRQRSTARSNTDRAAGERGP